MGERGTVTVLFSDVVSSTELLSRHGDAEFDVARRALTGLTDRAVTSHAGRVIKTLGDGAMATFASAAEALRAAIAIQRGATARTIGGEPLILRVGIAVGDVIFDGDDVHGTAVVEAARLCAAAPPGEILCADVVAVLARGDPGLVSEPLGDLQLKGLPEPVATRRVVWKTAATRLAFPRALAAELNRAFVGRRDLLESVRNATGRTDERSAVLLVGEPGIGKTRLAAEAAKLAHDDGALVLLGRCTAELVAPYAPWSDLVSQLIHDADDELLDGARLWGGVLARISAAVPRRFPDLPPPPPADPATERRRIAEAIDELLDDLRTTAPVLVVLEDLHWADEHSLAVLAHILRSGAPPGVAVIATYRDTDLDRQHPLTATLATLRRLPAIERVNLDGFDRAELGELVESVAGQEPDPALLEALDDQTEGNPFFAVEVLLHLAESGAYEQRDGRWVATRPISELGLPDGAREVISRRLSLLTDAANRSLELLAVYGAEGDADVIATVLGPAVDVIDGLDEAARRGLVRAVADRPGRYAFSHALVRQTLLDELSPAQRTRHHWHVGSALQQRRPAALDAAAYHLAEGALAGDVATAVDALLTAGNAALANDAPEQAKLQHSRALAALDVAESDDAERRWQALFGLGSAAVWQLDTPAVVEHLVAGVHLARQHGWSDRVAEAALTCTQFPDWSLPVDLLQEVVDEVLGGGPAPRERVRLLIARSRLHYAVMDLASARVVAAEAIEAARMANEWSWFLEAAWAYLEATNGGLPLRDEDALVNEVAEVASRPGIEPALAWRPVSQYVPLQVLPALRRGDRAAVDDVIVRADETYRGRSRNLLSIWKRSVAWADGRLDEFRELSDRVEREFPEFGIAQVSVAGDRLELAEQQALQRDEERVAYIAAAFGPLEPVIRMQTVHWEHALMGPISGRVSLLEQALTLLERMGPTCALGCGFNYLADSVARYEARHLATRMLPLLETLGGAMLSGYLGYRISPRHLALARVLGTLGRNDDAVVHARRAIDDCERFRAHGLATQARQWLAWALQRRDAPGDREAAVRELQRAAADADRFGMHLTADECRRWMAA